MTALHWSLPWLAAAALPAGAAVALAARRSFGRARASAAWGASLARGAAVTLALLGAAGPATVQRESAAGVVFVAASDATSADGAARVLRWPAETSNATRAVESLRAALPSDRPGDLVLAWSAPPGDPPDAGVAGALRPRGAPTWVLAPDSGAPAPSPASGARIVAPGPLVEGVAFRLVLESGDAPFAGGTATVAIDGVEQVVELPSRGRRAEVPPVELRGGVHSVAARFADRAPAALALRVGEAPQVLLVASGPAEPPLARRLRAQGLRVTTVSDATADLAPAADVVVLGPGAGRRSAADVASRAAAGAGLVVMGGPGAEGLSRLRGTALEPLLPVEVPEPPAPQPEPAPPPDQPAPPTPEAPKPVLDEGEKQALRVALLLCIDASGSMAGGKLVMAREAAIAAARTLTPEDRIGVLAFDEEFEWVVPFQRAEDMAALYRRIANLRAGGGTDFHPALRVGFAEIARQPCGIRHVILLTDGDTRAAVFREMVESASAHAITLSTVAVGDAANTQLLGLLAQWGRGRLYPAVDPQRLPQVITIDAKRFVEGPRESAKERIAAEDVVPPRPPTPEPPRDPEPPQTPPPRGPAPRAPVAASASPFLAGLEAEPWPALPHPETLRPRAPSNVPLRWGDGGAAMVLGRASGGRCAVLGADAFSADAGDVWSWPEGGRALAQLVRFLAPAAPPPEAGPAVHVVPMDSGRTAIVVETPAAGVLRARPAGGGDEIRVVCDPAGATAVGDVPGTIVTGVWSGEFAPTGGTETAPVAFVVPELRTRAAAELAADLADRSGARRTGTLPGPRRGDDRERREEHRLPFLLAASALLVVESALRRGARG